VIKNLVLQITEVLEADPDSSTSDEFEEEDYSGDLKKLM
jgi:hypothetical protein